MTSSSMPASACAARKGRACRSASASRRSRSKASPWAAPVDGIDRQSLVEEFPAYKSLSGRLSATFNLDGNHLARYVARRPQLIDDLYEDLLLHDQIRIPTSDFLTAAGLITCIGEPIFLRLLEDN